MTSDSDKMRVPCYTVLSPHPDLRSNIWNDMRLRNEIENGDLSAKKKALTYVIHSYLSDPTQMSSSMPMTVIRFLLQIQDHEIKRLLLMFWEVVPKLDASGELRPEMILVCESFRKDLQHPNEFIRGATLRLLCKLKHTEILEPLVSCVLECLSHSHKYVRKNAVLCALSFFKLDVDLIPQLARILWHVIEEDSDHGVKTNAFMAVCDIDEEAALMFVEGLGENVSHYCPEMQLHMAQLIYRASSQNPENRYRFMATIFQLTKSPQASVRLEAAWTYTMISTSQSAIKTAAKIYIDLAISQPDNNVKLVVLRRLAQLRDDNPKAVEALVLDLLRVLQTTSDLEVQRETLELSLAMIKASTAQDYVAILKKEFRRPQAAEAYWEIIVETLHQCVRKFPHIATSIVSCLVELVPNSKCSLALTVLRFLSEALLRFPSTTSQTISELLLSFNMIENPDVIRATCWVLGEFCESQEQVEKFLDAVALSFGPVPLVDESKRSEHVVSTEIPVETANCNGQSKWSKTKNRVTVDGTYASQSVFVDSTSDSPKPRFAIRPHLVKGDFHLATAICSALAKIGIKISTELPAGRKIRARALVIVAACLRWADDDDMEECATVDHRRRLHECLVILTKNDEFYKNIDTRKSLSRMFAADRLNSGLQFSEKKSKPVAQPIEQVDSPIHFDLLMTKEKTPCKDLMKESLKLALEGMPKQPKTLLESTLLGKVIQLTGHNDAVYSEAYVTITQHYIELDVLIVNQTNDTLQNCCLELRTWGKRREMGLFQKVEPIVLAGHDFKTVKATVEVTSTASGFIYGSIAYEVSGAAASRHVVALDSISINTVDFLIPRKCTISQFIQLWQSLMWEKTVFVSTPISDVRRYIKYIASLTNLAVITDESELNVDCGFIVANMCSRSMFEEDALVNVSLATNAKGRLEGNFRIRSSHIAVGASLGDKISELQGVIPPEFF